MSGEPDALQVDFTSGALAHRLRHGGGRRQALARAAGFRPGHVPRIVDATAGLGRDAFVLAALGAQVTMIERVPAVHAALRAAMDAARAEPACAPIIGRMRLIAGDARELLPELAPEVVMVDPMHPPRGNSALVRREMRDLRALVGDDPDAAELMAAALASARRRVVLKWPRKAAPMPGLGPPNHSHAGRTTRFDVYLPPARPAPG